MDIEKVYNPGQCPKPGIYPDMPEEQYRAFPALYQSLLSKVVNRDYSLNHVRDYITNPPAPTESMNVGTLFHKAVYGELQAEIDKVQQLPDEIKARRGAAYDELRKQNPDITYLPKKEYQEHEAKYATALRMAESVKSYPAYAMFCSKAKYEVAAFAWLEFVGPLTLKPRKVFVKGRFDLYMPGLILDLKKTVSTNPYQFGRSIASYGYHIQAALYTDIIAILTGEQPNFAFVACEDKPPYNVEIINGHADQNFSDGQLTKGRAAYQRAIDILLDALENNQWPGFADPQEGPVVTPIIPDWI